MKLFGHRENRMLTEIEIGITAIVTLIALGTIVYHYMEDWSWITSFYFSVTTLTTVGYGELYPTSELSRLFTALYVLSGVTVTLAVISVVGADFFRRRERRILERAREQEEDNEK